MKKQVRWLRAKLGWGSYRWIRHCFTDEITIARMLTEDIICSPRSGMYMTAHPDSIWIFGKQLDPFWKKKPKPEEFHGLEINLRAKETSRQLDERF